MKRNGVTIKEATGFARWFLNIRGSKAFTSCWDTVYILKEHIQQESIIAHELVHIEQMKRDGKLWMMIKTIYYRIAYKKGKGPYEIEAHEASDKIKKYKRKPLF